MVFSQEFFHNGGISEGVGLSVCITSFGLLRPSVQDMNELGDPSVLVTFSSSTVWFCFNGPSQCVQAACAGFASFTGSFFSVLSQYDDSHLFDLQVSFLR